MELQGVGAHGQESGLLLRKFEGMTALQEPCNLLIIDPYCGTLFSVSSCIGMPLVLTS